MKDFFKNRNNYSMTRLLAFIIVLTACSIAIIQAVTKTEINYIAIGSMLTIAMGGKVIQKAQEK